jgi:hypothetical protein
MCPQCKQIFKIWAKGNKTPEDAEVLRRKVPKRFTEVHRYWDGGQGTTVYVLQCNSCDQTFHVPH